MRGNRNEPNVARGHPLGRIREVLGNCYGQHGTERSVESQPTAALVGQDRGSQRAVVPSSDPATERMSMHLKEGSRARCTQWWTECAAGKAAAVVDDVAGLAHDAQWIGTASLKAVTSEESADHPGHDQQSWTCDPTTPVAHSHRGRCPTAKACVDTVQASEGEHPRQRDQAGYAGDRPGPSGRQTPAESE